jgi:uncharacterized protein (DUF2267 family)
VRFASSFFVLLRIRHVNALERQQSFIAAVEEVFVVLQNELDQLDSSD